MDQDIEAVDRPAAELAVVGPDAAIGAAGRVPVLTFAGLEHRFGTRPILRIDFFEVPAGEHGVLMGPSGTGKTTLLHLIAGLLKPSEGRIAIEGRWLDTMRRGELDRFRGRKVGIVLQRLHLLPALTVLGNLRLARWLAGLPADPAWIRHLLGALGIRHLARARPAELSQGEAQRVAIARTLVNRPRLILADEPTSALDDRNAALVIELLMGQAAASDATLIVATHDARIVDRFGHRLLLGRRG